MSVPEETSSESSQELYPWKQWRYVEAKPALPPDNINDQIPETSRAVLGLADCSVQYSVEHLCWVVELRKNGKAAHTLVEMDTMEDPELVQHICWVLHQHPEFNT